MSDVAEPPSAAVLFMSEMEIFDAIKVYVHINECLTMTFVDTRGAPHGLEWPNECLEGVTVGEQ